MLVLTRKTGEQLVIGENIVLTVLNIRGKRVKLGVAVPPEVPIRRRELLDRIVRFATAPISRDSKEV